MRERLGLDNGSAPALFPRRAPPQPPPGAADAAPPVPASHFDPEEPSEARYRTSAKGVMSGRSQ